METPANSATEFSIFDPRESFAFSILITKFCAYTLAIFTPLFHVRIISVFDEIYWTDLFKILFEGNFFFSASIIFLSCFALPIVYQTIEIYFFAKRNRLPRLARKVHSKMQVFRAWMMVDVFFLGILVSFIKLHEMVDIQPGIGGVSLAVCLALDLVPTARSKISKLGRGGRTPRKTNPASDVPTKTGGNAESWAFLISAAALYVPANLLPMMNVTMIGSTSSQTIISGIIYLMRKQEWLVAGVILIASVIVPAMKIFSIFYLLSFEKFFKHKQLKFRQMLYQFIEIIGKWSMVDIFVVGILVSSVNSGNFASISPNWGATFFCVMVIFTMGSTMLLKPSFPTQHNH